MLQIAIALASLLVASLPTAMGKDVLSKSEPPVDIVVITESDLAMNDAPPRTLKVLDRSEYNAVIRLAKSNDGHNGKLPSIREYDLTDSLGYKHNVVVTFMPRDVSWNDSTHSRPMQIDVFVSGPASFAYAMSETTGRVVFDCRCPDNTPVAIRTKYDDVIKSAVDSMVSLGKKK